MRARTPLHSRAPGLLGAGLGLFLLASCAHAPPPAAPRADEPQRKLELDPIVITAGRDQPAAPKTDVELFDDGGVFFRAGDFAKAAEHFDKLISEFPNSPQLAAALYNAGLSHERLGHWQEALDRFSEVLKRDPAGGSSVDASFHAATSEYKLDKKLLAADRLHALSERPGLTPQRKGEALVQEGVCRFESGARADAERLLRASLQIFDKGMGEGEVDPALPAQAEFWMGELYRSYFRDAPLDPRGMNADKLAEAMESKAQFLLSAQGHFLRAIRRGEGEWATASGFRIGELYEDFHGQLVNAPMPENLDAEQKQAYQRMLRERVRVLVSKAIRIYEQTLATAQRVGATSEYVEKTKAALERVKRLMLADEPSL